MIELPPEVERYNNSSTPRNSRTLTQQRRNTSRTNNQPISSLDIVPARGWIRTKEGEILLVGYDPKKTCIQRQRHHSIQCHSK
ncbi:hypothetical protein [Lyngbya sp. PCC 8106]|uniref:hypothetical protein n=1 Tax=Lyngbya sp. (strain PCC 8106) TaxID=313612 RepID=UPI0000EA9B23|nr:hypothetical protein [Lyngbya sp. PCC 8106]EAW35866.1 hypothetical protein L8106_02787 [Lyngbya sp. PCC 8106]